MHFESLGSIFGDSKTQRSQRGPGHPQVRREKKAKARRKASGKAPAQPARRRPNLSPAVRAQRKLQGRYMGLVRRLPKAKQAAVKKVRATKGLPAALRM